MGLKNITEVEETNSLNKQDKVYVNQGNKLRQYPIDDLLPMFIDNNSELNINFADNTEYRRGKAESLTLSLPENIPDTFHCSLVFDSPETATTITYPETINCVGDDCSEGVFIPEPSTSYELDIKYLGKDRIVARVGAF